MTGRVFSIKPFAETLAGRSVQLDLRQPRIMGILNVTPDSFSDGGRYLEVATAKEQARRMADEGADLIDIGGESTRPGAKSVSAQEEMDRVLPVIEVLVRDFGLPISIDTTKSVVARAAVEAGCEFVNDISGLTFDPAMATTVADLGAGLFVMHTRGRPEEMQSDTTYRDVVEEVVVCLRESLDRVSSAGLPLDKVAIDPGIGFGKDVSGNLALLHSLERLTELGRPILLGTSRKSFLGRILEYDQPEKRLYGALATVALGVASGARIFRTHDVAQTRDAAMTAWAVCQGQAWEPQTVTLSR